MGGGESSGLHTLDFETIGVYLRWTPHPVIVAVRDSKDYIRVLLYSYYATIAGWGVLMVYP